MKVHNFNEKIPQYLRTNPDLTDNELGVLLLIDNLYLDLPDDITTFKLIYPHFDPEIIENGHDGITFLDIMKKNYDDETTKLKLNNYLNIKFNYIGHYKSYEENMVIFNQYSKMVSIILNNLLKKAKFPKEIISVLREKPELKDCNDIFELIKLYKSTTEKRLHFAILRRIGMVVLISRIKRSFSIEDIDFATCEIEKAFRNNLLIEKIPNKKYYYWADHNYTCHYSDNLVEAKKNYDNACKNRQKLASKIHPMQIFETDSYKTKFGTEILNFEIRNKFRKNGNLYLTSVVEKILRKNLEFPNQIHDVIGLKIVVNNSDDIPKIIGELEIFLGGSSTRKKEKNSLNKFDKKKLSKYSTGEYFVWKAIYDIPLPHPSIDKVQETIKHVEEDSKAYKLLLNRIEYFKTNPRDFVVEVQIQDLNSYILSNADGSIPHHSMLKMVQIKENTFYKLFPIEIYKDELWKLKEDILNPNI